MPAELDAEIRFMAEELYIEHYLTQEQVAKKLGIAVNTVGKWAREGHWRQARMEFLATNRTMKQNLRRLRKKLIDRAIASEDPQTAYAALRAEGLEIKRREAEARAAGGGREPDVDRPKMFLEALEFVAGYLKDNDPEALKCLARNFEPMVAAFKESLNA